MIGKMLIGAAALSAIVGTTIFVSDGESAIKNSTLPQDKNQVLNIFMDIERVGAVYFENKETFVDMFASSALDLSYVQADGWTERIRKANGDQFVPADDTALITDYREFKGIKFTTTGADRYYNVFIDASGYEGGAVGAAEIENFTYEKNKTRYGENAISGTATALTDVEIVANTAKNTDGKYMVTVYKKQ